MKTLLLKFLMLCLVLPLPMLNYGQDYNYAEALQKSMFFYECQESGELSEDNRVTWRANSAMDDGSDVGYDLTGGWYDAGDHVKFNFPMAFSITALAWGGIEYANGYIASGQIQYLKRNLRWANDYFIKCHTASNELWGQVGNGGTDHAWWGSAEVMKMDRPAYKIDASNPGSDLAAETAAAMAASSILFKDDDPSYAAELIQHAVELYNFADNYRGVYSNSITDAAGYYQSYSGYNDELVWGAIWLYRATDNQEYLDKAEEYYDNMGTEGQTDYKKYKWGIAWDDKSYGCYALLANITGEQKYIDDVERYLDYWTDGFNGERITYTPGGLAFLDIWGCLRYSINTAFIALYHMDNASSTEKAQTYYNFALSQLNYALGNNPLNSSYVVGFGENPPENPHHRTAHGCWSNNQNGPPDETRHILYGALVGGPNNDDSYEDDRANYTNNEVACDYNALYSGVLAALVEEYAGSPLTNFPVAEVPSDEYFIEAKVNASGDQFTEWAVWTYNHTAWPAREANEYKFRLFINISEGIDAGYTSDDYIVSSNNEGVVSYTGLLPWDETESIYYVEVTYDPSVEIYPGGLQYDKKEAQMRIRLPYDADASAWDPSNDPASEGLGSELIQMPTIPLYVDGVLVFGEEPSPAIAVELVTVEPSTLSLDEGESYQLTVTVLPENATNKSVTWTSSNTTIATVGSSGYVTAVSAGQVTITATASGSDVSDACEVTVNEIAVTGISLSQTSLQLDINQSATLEATIIPSNASDKSVTWISSNENVASVSSSGVVTGVVTGVGQGDAVITAISSDPDISASCSVEVSDVVIIPQYTLSINISGSGVVTVDPSADSYDEGTEVTLTATASEGYLFSGWGGDIDGSENPVTITMDADKSVTATFVVDEEQNCDSSSSVIVSMPYSLDGIGEYCLQTSDDIAYVNSWNLSVLEINGVDYTNTWSNTMPDKLNGKYYIYYVGDYLWSHFEAAAAKTSDTELTEENASEIQIYPNPVKGGDFVVELISQNTPEQLGISILNLQGQVVFKSIVSNINEIHVQTDLSPGMYILCLTDYVDIAINQQLIIE